MMAADDFAFLLPDSADDEEFGELLAPATDKARYVVGNTRYFFCCRAVVGGTSPFRRRYTDMVPYISLP